MRYTSMVKKASSLATKVKKKIDNESISALADKLSERPYGEEKVESHDSLVRTTVSINASMLIRVEDYAKSNKRAKSDLKSVSAIVRKALDEYCEKYEV